MFILLIYHIYLAPAKILSSERGRLGILPLQTPSAETLSDTLKFFINGLKTTKGIERNLFAKKFLSNIFYSPESIKIRFISRQSDGEAVAERDQPRQRRGWASEHSHLKIQSSYLIYWLHTLNEIRTHFRQTPDE